MEDLEHIKDCELGSTWEECPACVDQYNSTCTQREKRPMPEKPQTDEDE